MKITHVVGARPQFIKYFPISKVIDKLDDRIENILIHTGQHYDYSMSKVFFDEFGIREPDYHLGVGSGTHGEQVGRIVERVEDVLLSERPDIVFVYGDTNSTLGGALASVKVHIPVVHVESGLRSFDKSMPEEINRILTDHISAVLFCPSETAVRNLHNEGFGNILNDGKLVPLDYKVDVKLDINNPVVINVGDVMYDALIYSLEIAARRSKILDELNLIPGDYYLLTLHRAENTDNIRKFEELIDFVNEVSGGRNVIFPMHPRTRKVYSNVSMSFSENVHIIDPVSYFDMLILLKNSAMLMTDSGGMQKEAFWLRVPCITLRDETEWIETVESGWNVLYKDYRGKHDVDKEAGYYGDGRAAERMVNVVLNVKID